MAIGPDGNLYEGHSNSIRRRSPSTGNFIDTYYAADSFLWCFGPDGNLYVLSGVDNGVHFRRVAGPLSPNAKQVDPAFEASSSEYHPWRIEFGPDITGDGVKEFYVLVENALLAYDGSWLIQGGLFVEVTKINSPTNDGFRNFASASDGSVYIWHRYFGRIDKYSLNPATHLFDSLGTFISGSVSDSAGVLTFGPDVNNDGVEDLYTTFGTSGPAHLSLYDGVTGTKIKSFIQTTGPKLGPVVFGPAKDSKTFNLFSLSYGVSFVGDSYVRTDLDVRRNDNYGLQDFIEVGTGRGGDAKPFGAADAIRGLIFGFGNSRFDIRSLPHEPISSAILELTVKDFPSSTNEIYHVDIHRLIDNGSAPYDFLLEGNGFEGSGGPAGSTDPDTAEGVAWAGSDKNTDPFAENNYSQPNLDPNLVATAVIDQKTTVPGTVIRWDVTRYVQGLLYGNFTFGGGIVLRDVTSSGAFRELRFHSKDSPNEAYRPKLHIGYGKGNLDADDDVDKNDLAVITRAFNTVAYGPNDSRDLDKDGFITVLDARKLVTRCTRPLCATN